MSEAITVTFFNDRFAKTKSEETLPVFMLGARIYAASAPEKSALPWLKCARFGDVRSDKNSLRHDGNVLTISGVEGDYDGGKASFDAAVKCLRDAGVSGIVYTSPSYSPAFPKWRVLCSFSCELPPIERDRMMGRLAGLFAAIGVEFANESWTLSQSYFYGSVNGNPAHQVQHIDGMPLDLRDDLDATAIGKPERAHPNGSGRPAGPATRPEDITDERIRGLTATLLANVSAAPDGEKHHTLLRIARTLGGYLHLIGWSEHEAVEQLLGALPNSVQDWDLARRTALDGLRFGMANPLELEDRPNPNIKAPSDWEEQHPPNDGEPPQSLGNGAQLEIEGPPAPSSVPAPPSNPGPLPGPTPDDTAIDVLAEIAALGAQLTRKELVETFNRKYAMANEGGKAVVIWAIHDPVLRRDRHERASFPDFERFYQNHTLSIVVKKQTITKSFAAWWLNSPKRRQYLGGVVFDPANRTPPDTMNLWRGWAVEPARGDWSLMREHIRLIICGGRAEIFDYVIRWLSHMTQQPHLAAEIAIVLRGLKGTGKGMLGKWLLRLCGQHGLHIVDASHLTGRFRGHLRDAVFVFADEAFFAGDRQHEGVLKAIITESLLLLEAKYRTPVMTPNMLHLLMASNATWVIPASHDERRYLMLDVAADKKDDAQYFRKLDQQMEQGGLAAMLHDLLHLDLGDFHPRVVPKTTELVEQKIHSFDSLHRWWETVLDRAFVWRSRYGHKDFLKWDEFVSTELLNQSYRQWCADNRVTRPEHREALGRFMTKFYPSHRPRGSHPVYEAENVDRDYPQPVVQMDRPPGYSVGDLDQARKAFSEKLAFPAGTFAWEKPQNEP